MNLSYCFRANLPDLVKNGSFRSTADPMMVMYKGEYFLFATNQAGFYYSKDLSNWEFVFAGFQRYPEDDDLCAPAAFRKWRYLVLYRFYLCGIAYLV